MLTSVQNVCVVTTFYTLESMKSILLPKFVFFSFKATPFSQKYKFIILLVYLFFMGCCTSYYNIPAPLPEGGFDSGIPLLTKVLPLTVTWITEICVKTDISAVN